MGNGAGLLFLGGSTRVEMNDGRLLHVDDLLEKVVGKKSLIGTGTRLIPSVPISVRGAVITEVHRMKSLEAIVVRFSFGRSTALRLVGVVDTKVEREGSNKLVSLSEIHVGDRVITKNNAWATVTYTQKCQSMYKYGLLVMPVGAGLCCDGVVCCWA